MSKKQVIVFVGVMLVITALIFWEADFIERHGSAAQVWVMVMLILLTAAYVFSTKRMAEEMKEQRYAALKPIVDIMDLEMQMKPMELSKLGYVVGQGNFPQALRCILRNVGVGPALNVYSRIEDAEGEPRQWNFGVIPIAIGEEEMGRTHEMRLFLEKRDDHRALIAYYEDVYGNIFESSREVSVSKEKNRLEIGPLKVRKLSKEERTK